jgi:hypothetical protein
MTTHPTTREGSITELLTELTKARRPIEEAGFRVLGALIAGAVLDADTGSLRAARNGLRRLYGAFFLRGHHMSRGRILGLIDVATHALGRLA